MFNTDLLSFSKDLCSLEQLLVLTFLFSLTIVLFENVGFSILIGSSQIITFFVKIGSISGSFVYLLLLNLSLDLLQKSSFFSLKAS